MLGNAREIRNVPGRKSDVNDAAWIADLLAHGLIRASFVPPIPVQELRDLTRTRKQLAREIVQHTQRIQKTLQTANIKLRSVLTDILGHSGRAILSELLKGETDPDTLAQLADTRVKASRAKIAEALRGKLTEHHRFLIRAELSVIDALSTMVGKLERRLEASRAAQVPAYAPVSFGRRDYRRLEERSTILGMKAIVIHHRRKRIEAGQHFGPIAAFFGFLLAGCASTSPAHSAPPVERPRATEQESLIAARTGLWDVTETVWASPGAAPVTTTGLVAERRMIGTMLQEVLRVGENVSSPVDRIDYLRYSRSEGHWDYVSMDTRADVGIMPAWSFASGDNTRIDLTFAPFALPTGMMLHMTEVITFEGSDRDRKDQQFLVADGTGRAWLAHRYVYVRRHA